MAREASEPPKERVNIKYVHAIGDAQEEKELPLKLLVLGDFTHRPDDRAVEDRKPTAIDKDSFNEVLKAHELQLSLTVPNKLAAGPDLAVNLKIDTDKGFGPDSIVEQVPELAKLLRIREALKLLRGPLGNLKAFRQRIDQIVTDPALKKRILQELGIAEAAAEG